MGTESDEITEQDRSADATSYQSKLIHKVHRRCPECGERAVAPRKTQWITMGNKTTCANCETVFKKSVLGGRHPIGEYDELREQREQEINEYEERREERKRARKERVAARQAKSAKRTKSFTQSFLGMSGMLLVVSGALITVFTLGVGIIIGGPMMIVGAILMHWAAPDPEELEPEPESEQETESEEAFEIVRRAEKKGGD